MIINLNSLQNIQDIKCDLCIVGGGPAGAILFEKLSETKKDIVLLESGSVDIEEKYQTLNEGKILLNGKNRNADHEVDLNNALSIWRLRGLGGTTNHWTGSCTKFTDMDFLKRDWINLSGWPLSKTELDQY